MSAAFADQLAPETNAGHRDDASAHILGLRDRFPPISRRSLVDQPIERDDRSSDPLRRRGKRSGRHEKGEEDRSAGHCVTLATKDPDNRNADRGYANQRRGASPLASPTGFEP